MAKDDRFRKSYHFFLEKEQTLESFSIQDICKATGWAESTVRTYLAKKWNQFASRDGDRYYSHGIDVYTEDEYVRFMSQRQDISAAPKRPDLNPHVEGLVVKAREAAIHALDSYNRPCTHFRTEGFIVMMIVAWTSLLHAIFEERGIDYFYYNEDGSPQIIDGDKKAWDITQCLKAYFGSANPPVRENLQFIIKLRNKIEHRFVPAIDPHVAGECQASILNFDDLLVQEFGDYYALRETLAVPLQTTHLRTGSQLEALKRFQGNEYDELTEFIDTYRSGLPDAIYQDPRYSFRVFLIPKIGNHESSSDIAFEFVKYDPSNPEDMQALEKQVALIKERQVLVANAGCFKPSHVARLVAEKTGREFGTHQHHTKAWKMYDIRKSGIDPEGCNTKYCQYDVVHGDYVYTQAWVDFLVDKMSDNAEYEKLIAFKC